VNWVDPLGLEVSIRSRTVRNSAGWGAHTWTQVDDSKGKTTYSGTDEDGKLGVKENLDRDFTPSEDNPETSKTVVPPPPGMNQEQWDKSVRESAEREKKKDKKRKYKRFGGDGGKTSGNCHSVTSNIIEGAGGKVPKDYNPPGFAPGLRQ